jgi:hypothetical protein
MWFPLASTFWFSYILGDIDTCEVLTSFDALRVSYGIPSIFD